MLIFEKHSDTILLDLIMLDDKSGLASPLFSFAGKTKEFQSSTLSKILMRNSSATPFAKVASYDAYCYFVASFAHNMAFSSSI